MEGGFPRDTFQSFIHFSITPVFGQGCPKRLLLQEYFCQEEVIKTELEEGRGSWSSDGTLG